MIHPTDDELLELALAGEDLEVGNHVRECADCSARFDLVRAEQDLLRRAFAEVDPPARIEKALAPRRRGWIWAAAGFLLCAAAGAFGTRAMAWRRDAKSLTDEVASLKTRIRDLENRPTPSTVERMQQDLKTVSHQIDGQRDEIPAESYVGLVERGEDLYVDWLALSLCLTPDQKAALRRIIDRDDFREAVRPILNEEQYRLFVEYEREEAEEARHEDIDFLADEIAELLDLRHSEAGRVHDVLEEKYPKRSGVDFESCPADELAKDPGLAAAVRKALDRRHYPEFDAWLEEVKKDCEEAAQAIRTHRGDK